MYSLWVRGKTERAPVNRIFLVGRNHHAHAVEMGRPVDKRVEVPFYFTKAPGTLVESGATVPYPPGTSNYHFEMELVLAIGKPGFRVSQTDAASLIYGYACGLDMTRRDLQLIARERAGPWTWARTLSSRRHARRRGPGPAGSAHRRPHRRRGHDRLAHRPCRMRLWMKRVNLFRSGASRRLRIALNSKARLLTVSASICAPNGPSMTAHP